MKLKTLFLWALLLPGAMSSFAQVASGECGENLTWTLSEDGTLTVSGTGKMTDYFYSEPEVPWISYTSSIITVIIENGVTSIGNFAFSSCHSLTSVTIPESVTSIGNEAFSYCYRLTSVTILESVTSIGERAFYSCDSLTSIEVLENNAAYASENGILFDKTKTTLVLYPAGKTDENYTIPNSVTSIGNSAFSYCLSLISVIIPESVTSIGERGFSYCLSLTSVSIPNSVTSIGEGAFYYCLSLVSVTIPESVTSIGNDAFFGCDSLTVIEVLENNAVYASENGVLFNKTKTTLVLYPEGKTDENYTIPNSVTSIGERAFFYCRSLPSVTIPENVTSIGYAAFSFCSSLTSIIISENVTSIGEYAFSGCRSLPSVTIPESVISIGYAAFNSCRSLTSVIISENMTSIGDYAFYNCSSLILVTNLNPTPQEINLNVFGSVAIDKVVLSVPAKSVETYKAAPVWQDFKIITACTPSAINTPAIANAVRIYPDPSTESFRIDGLTTPTQVSITDISGKTLLQQTVKGEENIFVGHLPQGIYLIRVNGETTKIIKTF